MAQITEKIVEIKAKVDGATTVKDLKEQIAELTNLMNTLDKESKEYQDTVNLLVDAEEELTNAMKVGKSQLSAQEGSYNALVNRMAALKKAHKSVTDEMTRNRLSEEINDINNQLKEMDANNGVYVRNVGNYENAIKKALKTPQQELKALRTQLAQLEEGTDEYNATFARMAQLTHDVTEQQEKLRWSSSDLGDILGNLSGVATSLAGGFSAFNALDGLLGGDNEDVEKAMLQAQRFIQLIQGLEQLEQLGDKIQGLWTGIKNFSTNSAAAAVSLGDFNKNTEKAENAIVGTTNATSASAAVTAQAANSTNEYKEASKGLSEVEQKRIENIQNFTLRLKLSLEEEEKELQILREKAEIEGANNEDLQRKIRAIEREINITKQKINSLEREEALIQSNTSATQANTSSTIANTTATNVNTTATELNHKGLKGRLATFILQSAANKKSVAEINAMTTAQLVNTAATVAWAGALKILKTALISTGIGAIIVLLGTLLSYLGDGLSYLWGWINGANKAKEQTENLKNSLEALNQSLEAQEKSWSRQEKLLKAQGKSYEEIYEARKKNLQAQLAETQALLATQKAIAKEIGERKLQKDKYEEFRKSLEELEEKEKGLQETLSNLNYDKFIKGIEDATKAEKERQEALRKAAEEAEAAYKKEKESAEKLYKDLIQYYKDEKTKLKEKYESEKALLEKFGKDTTNLTKKYEEEKTAIVLKEAEKRRKLTEQFNKDFDATFRNDTLAFFENQLSNASDKLQDFKDVASTIKIDEQGFRSAENWTENIKKLGEQYGVNIQNMEHFDLVFKKVIMDYEDAQKALEDYQNQLKEERSNNRVAQIEKEFEAINSLMDIETEEKQLEYELYASQGKWYDGLTNNYISQMKLRWETEDAIFNLRKGRLKEEIEIYKAAANDESLTEEAKLEALKKVAELERQLMLETADYTIAQNERKNESTENYVKSVQDSLDGISSILSNVATAWETNIQTEIETGKISEEEGERRMEEMKDIQSAIALINTFSSAVSAYQSLASIPIVGPVLGAAASAAAIASGLAQVKAIQAVKKGDNGGDNTRYAEVQPQIPNDYSPQAVTNITGGQETESLANALSKQPVKAYVVESEITSTQEKVAKRNQETSF